MGEIIQDFRLTRKIELEKTLQAIQTIKDFCNSQYQEDCDAGKCPISEWCHQDKEEYPCNWYDTIKRRN